MPKLVLSSKTLHKSLQLVYSAVSRNPILPILECVLLLVNGGKLTVIGSDLENTITNTLDVLTATGDDYSIAIPAKILIDTISTLPDQPLKIKIDIDTFKVVISSESGKYTLAGVDPAAYPKHNDVSESGDVLTLTGNQVYNTISNTLFATSSDDLRPQFTGILYDIKKDRLVCVATDAQKLVKYTVFSDIGFEKSVVIAKKTATILKGFFSASGIHSAKVMLLSDVSINIGESVIIFNFGDITIRGVLIDARFPNYDAIIPAHSDNRILVTRLSLLDSLKRVLIYANMLTIQVLLDISESEINVNTSDSMFAKEAFEIVSCRSNVKDISICFNCKMLIEVLSANNSSEIELMVNSSTTALIMNPVVDGFVDYNLTTLIMPLQIT